MTVNTSCKPMKSCPLGLFHPRNQDRSLCLNKCQVQFKWRVKTKSLPRHLFFATIYTVGMAVLHQLRNLRHSLKFFPSKPEDFGERVCQRRCAQQAVSHPEFHRGLPTGPHLGCAVAESKQPEVTVRIPTGVVGILLGLSDLLGKNTKQKPGN